MNKSELVAAIAEKAELSRRTQRRLLRLSQILLQNS